MILVVASEQATRDALTKLVSSLGYKVAALECGQEMITQLRFRPPSLVILDCDWKDSFEMLQKVRGERLIAQIPFVMFSEGGENLREKALGKGAQAFVPKGTLDWAELVTQIQNLVGPPTDGRGE